MRRTLCITKIFLLITLAAPALSQNTTSSQETSNFDISIDIAFGSEKNGTRAEHIMRCAEDSPCARAEKILPVRSLSSDVEPTEVIGLAPIPFLGIIAIGSLLLISLTPSSRSGRSRNH